MLIIGVWLVCLFLVLRSLDLPAWKVERLPQDRRRAAAAGGGYNSRSEFVEQESERKCRHPNRFISFGFTHSERSLVRCLFLLSKTSHVEEEAFS